MEYVIIYGSSYICNLPMNKGHNMAKWVDMNIELRSGVSYWTVSLMRKNAALFPSHDDAVRFLKYFSDNSKDYHIEMNRCKIIPYINAPVEL